ncbi:unnamed protein product [Agarophyton chilense]|eukprot:gb/GEZJ01005514.1/.p1 GENE.gb/GEZJ01005514.1/~~gb/GEZJ01005514.1/.p1  ORF type:complete len:511 (-),score=100.65 gb/GEZJ01005514.1/:232-1764(-)
MVEVNCHDLSSVESLISSLQTKLRQAHNKNNRNEAQILSYQRRLFKLLRKQKQTQTQISSSPSKRGDPNVQHTPSKQAPLQSPPSVDKFARLAADLDVSRSKVRQLTEQNLILSKQLKDRDETIASDATEMAKLRQQDLQLRDVQMQLKLVQSEKEALEIQTSSLSSESNLRMTIGEQNVRFLQKEVKRLNEELATTRCEADAAAASSSSALRTANELQNNLSQQVLQVRSTNARMEQYIADLEKQLSSVRTAAEQQRSTSEQEIARLGEIADIQKQMTSQAEQRVKDYEAIIETLQQELQQNEQPTTIRSVQSHTEVLLKSMEQTLDAKQAELRQMHLEQQKLKAAHGSMVQNEQHLKRTAEEAREEAKQAQREILRLKAIMKEDSVRRGRSEPKGSALRGSHETRRLSFGTTSGAGRESGSGRFSGFGRSSAFGQDPAFGRESGMGRHSDFDDPEIGPRSTIPLHPPHQNANLADVDAHLQELFNIRMRHQKILAALQDRRNARMSTE